MTQARGTSEDLRAHLRAHGMPYTVQRHAIFEELSGRTDHPSADAIFEAVKNDVPGLSRTTVYRTLEAFVDAGLLTRVSHPGASTRYDPKTHRHHHLVCESCGDVIDLEPTEVQGGARLRLSDTSIEVRDYSIHFSGVCPDCA